MLGPLVLTLLVCSALAQPTYAYHDWAPTDHWSYTQNTCTWPNERQDPANIIMFGDLIGPRDVQQMVDYHTGWGDSIMGSGGQWVSIGAAGACEEMTDNNASGTFLQERHHVRWSVGRPASYSADLGFYQVTPTNTSVVSGTPHYEIRDCGGHVVTSFTDTRNTIVGKMASQHPYYWNWTPATVAQGSPQCGGTRFVYSDGWAAYVHTWLWD